MKKNIVRHGSLFAGIGGFDLAASWMGWQNVFHCEINPFCRQILKYYFPNSKSYEDIKKANFSPYRGKIDVVTGGFPCQPYSLAGRRAGKDDERHPWPAMLSAIQQIKPDWVVAENVFGIVSWNEGVVFEEVHTDLEAQGYDVQAFVLPAAAVGAPHRRDRVWLVAQRNEIDTYSHVSRLQKKRPKQQTKGAEQHRKLDFDVANTDDREQPKQQKCCSVFGGKSSASWRRAGSCTGYGNSSRNIAKRIRQLGAGSKILQKIPSNTISNKQCQRRLYPQESQPARGNSRQRDTWHCRDPWKNFPLESPLCPGDDGFPTFVDTITFSKWRTESIKAAGNALVPQVAFRIFQAIQATKEICKKQ